MASLKFLFGKVTRYIKNAIYNVISAWADLTISNLISEYNKLWLETVYVDEIMQFYNNELNSETLTMKDVMVMYK